MSRSNKLYNKLGLYILRKKNTTRQDHYNCQCSSDTVLFLSWPTDKNVNFTGNQWWYFSRVFLSFCSIKEELL